MNVDSLCDKLKRSWRAAGYPDDSIAEDVAFSVELALSDSGRGEAFTPEEIDSFVLKVLREAGLTEVAEHYGLDFSPVDSMVPLDLAELTDIIARFMPLDGADAENLAAKVMSAAKGFGASKLSPTLVLELARHFHSLLANVAEASVTTERTHSESPSPSSVWLANEDEIRELAGGRARTLLASGVLTARSVSALFPSIKIEFDIAKFADSLDLTPPAPEFALLPRFAAVMDAVNDIVGGIDGLMSKNENRRLGVLPVHLKILNPDVFTKVWLGGEWPESRRALVEMMELLSEASAREIHLHA
jgi:hypothetical protein